VNTEIRQELEKMGATRVRKAMVAFEHRPHRGDSHRDRCDYNFGACCFIAHAFEKESGIERCGLTADYLKGRRFMEGFDGGCSMVENLFERGDREGLRQECITFLAEHGVAPEPKMNVMEKVMLIFAPFLV